MIVREPIRKRGQARINSAAAEAWVSVIGAADYIVQQGEVVFARHGITGDQFNVLRILRGARPDGLPRGEVGRRLLRRSPDVTRMLDRLERRDLIERVRITDDGRLSIARITKPGLALLERVDPEIAAVMSTVTSPLSEAQLRRLARLCDALVP
ncbi:MAG: MarR family winged helix-turn-helix transcriptional regulator [Gemmatimonadaceae bacterium]